jgi:CDP-2,3-bis-(O-geranylgeranyl)-sn-glycerol synthase
MVTAILSAIWFFAPAGHANTMPVFAAKIPWLSKFDQPLDFHKTFRGKRIFGDHKTWRGLIFAFFATIPLIVLQTYLYRNYDFIRDISFIDYTQINSVLLAFLFTIGALGGDAIKSFFKRQLDVPPGETWFPFDQLDYVIGGLIATAPVVQLEPSEYLMIILIFFVLHPATTTIGYFLKIREKPI